MYTASQAGDGLGDQRVFLFCKGKHSFPLQSKAGIYNEPNSAKFPISYAPRTFIEDQICLYSKRISSIVSITVLEDYKKLFQYSTDSINDRTPAKTSSPSKSTLITSVFLHYTSILTCKL